MFCGQMMSSKYQVLLMLTVICVIGQASCAAFWWEKAKPQLLNRKSFKNVIGKDKYVFVDFYTKACPYCEKLYPKVNQVMDEYASKRPDIVFAKVDAEESPELADEYGVEQYPWLLVFKPGDVKFPETYNYDHTYNALKGYLDSLPSTKKPIAEKSSNSNDADQKTIAALRDRIKQLEKIESSKDNMTTIGLKDLINTHEKSMDKSIKNLKRNLQNFKKTQFQPKTQSSEAETSAPAASHTASEDAEDDSDVDYGYSHAWWIKMSCLGAIGGVFFIVFDRNRMLNRANTKLNID